MSRKLAAICVTAVAVLSFALPPSAATATTLTQPTGTKVAAGSLFRGTAVGQLLVTTVAGETLWACSAGETTGEVVTPGSVTGIASFNITASSFNGTGTQGDCTSSTGTSFNYTTSINGGVPYCVKTISEKDEIETRGGKCSEAPRSTKFTLDFTGGGSCGYEIASSRGTFRTDTVGDALVTMAKAGPYKRYESEGVVSPFCPSEFTQDVSYALEKDETTVTPIYIS
jgi:hypothetical protein